MELVHDIAHKFIDTYYICINSIDTSKTLYKKFNIAGFTTLGSLRHALGIKDNFPQHGDEVNSLRIDIIYDVDDLKILSTLLNKVEQCGFRLSTSNINDKKNFSALFNLNHKYLPSFISPLFVKFVHAGMYAEYMYNLDIAGFVYNPIDDIISHLWVKDLRKIERIYTNIRNKRSEVIGEETDHLKNFIKYWKTMEIDIIIK